MKTIKINALQFADHCGHERSKLLICNECQYFVGEAVELTVFSVHDSIPTGASIVRYVEDIVSLSVSRDEDSYFELLLCSFKPESYMTGHSFFDGLNHGGVKD